MSVRVCSEKVMSTRYRGTTTVHHFQHHQFQAKDLDSEDEEDQVSRQLNFSAWKVRQRIEVTREATPNSDSGRESFVDKKSPPSHCRSLVQKSLDRHSRPLTPPGGQNHQKKNFSVREWYENNRQFAAKYLNKGQFKFRDSRKDESRSDVSAKHEFIFDLSASGKTKTGTPENNENSTGQSQNQAITQRVVRRRRRRVLKEVSNGTRRSGGYNDSDDDNEYEDDEDGDEELQPRSQQRNKNYRKRNIITTPARRVWDYRDGVINKNSDLL